MPDTTISGLTADAAPTGDDLVVTVNDPLGTPGNRKATLTNLFASAPSVTAFFSHVSTDGTLAADSDTLVSSQKATKTYVDAFIGTGVVHTSDTDASGYGFTSNDTTLGGSSAIHLTTEHAVKVYVDTAVAGITPGSTYADNVFTLQDNSDATKQLQFEVGGIPTATLAVYTVPAPVGGTTATLVTQAATQTLTNKTVSGGAIRNATGTGITIGNIQDTTFTNDFSRTNLVEIFVSTTGNNLAFIQQGGNAVTPAQTGLGATLGALTFRGYDGSAFSTAAAVRFNVTADEAVTSSARGARFGVFTTPLTTTTALEAFRLTSDAVPGGVFRGAVAVGAGSGMASATTGTTLDVTSGVFAMHTAALTYASPTSVDVTTGNVFTVTTVNATGSVTFNATAPGKSGTRITIIITNDATSGKTITFGTNFRSTGTLVGTTSKVAVIVFTSDGSNWIETARTLLIT